MDVVAAVNDGGRPKNAARVSFFMSMPTAANSPNDSPTISLGVPMNVPESNTVPAGRPKVGTAPVNVSVPPGPKFQVGGPSLTFAPVTKSSSQPTHASVTPALSGVSSPWMDWNRMSVPMTGPPAPSYVTVPPGNVGSSNFSTGPARAVIGTINSPITRLN